MDRSWYCRPSGKSASPIRQHNITILFWLRIRSHCGTLLAALFGWAVRFHSKETTIMRQGMTNIGKKESRQIDRLLTKAAQEGTERIGGKEVEARTVPKQHRLKGRRIK